MQSDHRYPTSLANSVPTRWPLLAALLAIPWLPGHCALAASPDGHHSPHHVAFQVGLANHDAENSGFVGIDYEYSLTPVFAVGAFYDTTFGDFDVEAIGAQASVQPFAHWKVIAGLGWERKINDDKDKKLSRLSTSYGFPVGRVSVGPVATFDVVENTTRIFYLGVQVGIGF